MTTHSSAEVIVIGAGIAGASLAAELSAQARVVLLEMESQPGYHTTGRSAAVFAPIYGPPVIRALTRASESFFRQPPDGFAEHSLFSSRHILMIGQTAQMPAVQQLHRTLSNEGPIELLDGQQVRALQPLLKARYIAAGVLDRSGQDIDVHALHQGYLRQFKARAGMLINNAEVTALKRAGGLWQVQTSQAVFSVPTVVNAAGAWADQVGAQAGAERIGLQPKRRTALIVAAPQGVDITSLPITIDIDEQFYLKPDAGRLLISPANKDPEIPCDVQPDPMDIALCVDRIERAFDLKIARIENRWAGLRSFVSGGSPVAGFSAQVPGFYWLAGQGGYGIQSAPALSRFAAAQILGEPLPQDLQELGVDTAALSPERVL